MRILVTGGAGFIGSHVVDAYVKAGHRVTVVDNLSSGKRSNINPRARFVKADIQSPSLARLFRTGRFDAVNHHSAQIDVRKSVADPLFDARVNVLGLLNLLECSRTPGVKRFIMAASGGTYYGECRHPARESDPARPLSPYGITKLASEHYLRAYRKLHGLKYVVLRYGNVFGPRQDPHGEAGVVAIFCNRLLANETVFIYGDGKQQRDYVYVGDVARANVLALGRGTDESINIGTGRPTSVNELYRILKSVHRGAANAVHKPPRPGELSRSVLNAGLARRVLNWRARVGMEEGLLETYKFIEGMRKGT